MQNRLFRKSLVIGIIILFVGASILPVVNSMKIQNNLYDNPNPSGLQRWIFCRFNLTFFGEAYRCTSIWWWGFILFNSFITYDNTHSPNAILKITTWSGEEVTYPFSGNNTFRFFLIFEIDTDMEDGNPTHDGYIKGKTLSLIVYNSTSPHL